jgi:hypothetical protein
MDSLPSLLHHPLHPVGMYSNEIHIIILTRKFKKVTVKRNEKSK